MPDNERWIGFRKSTGTNHVCPENKIFDMVGISEVIQILAIGFEPYKIGQYMYDNGFTPQMEDVHKFIMNKRPGRPPRAIVCNQTGIQYSSINKAAMELQIASGNLNNHLRHPEVFKSVRGLTFRYHVGL